MVSANCPAALFISFELSCLVILQLVIRQYLTALLECDSCHLMNDFLHGFVNASQFFFFFCNVQLYFYVMLSLAINIICQRIDFGWLMC